MLESLNKNFGLLIAFVLPGFVFLLVSIAMESKEFYPWPTDCKNLLELSGLLLLLLASIAVGIILSAVRWLLLDPLHHWTGIPAPSLDYRNLERRQASFMLIVENNYRFYLFYGNTLVAMVVLGISALYKDVVLTQLTISRWCAVCIVLYLASRDSLRRYYNRSRLIMGEAPPVRNTGRRKQC